MGMQVVLFCGDQLSAAELSDLALDKFNIRVAPDFQVPTGALRDTGSSVSACRIMAS